MIDCRQLRWFRTRVEYKYAFVVNRSNQDSATLCPECLVQRDNALLKSTSEGGFEGGICCPEPQLPYTVLGECVRTSGFAVDSRTNHSDAGAIGTRHVSVKITGIWDVLAPVKRCR